MKNQVKEFRTIQEMRDYLCEVCKSKGMDVEDTYVPDSTDNTCEYGLICAFKGEGILGIAPFWRKESGIGYLMQTDIIPAPQLRYKAQRQS